MRRLSQKLNRLICLLLAVCLLAALPLEASAIEVDYETMAICGGFIRVNRYTGVLQGVGGTLTGDLVIPEEVESVKITAIGDRAFYGCENLTSVKIPGSVELIGDGAFQSCLALKSASIGEGVKYLGKDAFRYCYSLNSVSLPSTLNAVEDYAFYSCLALPSISIPSGVSRLGAYAFAGCKNLKTASLAGSVSSIGEYCFSECEKLTGVNLPSGMTSVPTALFNGCTSLAEVTVPGGVQRISGLAFRGCTSLRKLSLPDSVTSIVGSAFDSCGDVTFYVNAGSYSQAFAAANNIPFVLGELPNTPPAEDPGNYGETPFTDIANYGWAQKYIEWAYAMGYISGTTKTTFAPGANISRGQIVTILYRMDGSPAVGRADFTDLEPGRYYVDPVAWAQKNNIVSGVGDGTRFAPNQSITREQMAAILYRYAKYKGKNTSAQGDMTQFRDTASISKYAGTAVSWAVGSGIISGKGNATLDPRGTATRAEAAVMLSKFSNLK